MQRRHMIKLLFHGFFDFIYTIVLYQILIFLLFKLHGQTLQMIYIFLSIFLIRASNSIYLIFKCVLECLQVVKASSDIDIQA